ncbi:chemotaxis protein CheW [Polynucleobacter sphagniphilus]|uniref:chemotaxis protein CheW n=1 Tax=Polynucleobacter sphagniphilus TaxID=1743169 RepID=UPI0024065FC1|nr:chemotaxis protein CheW [Polynucleobacter sphagniphilus]MDF9788197.1 purine-binding chemotaxis protein CheW [Polynucleobacter sphagniphilus]
MPSFLVFESESAQYAVPIESVGSMFWMPELAPIEAAPPWFVGLVNWHGEIVHVLDLGLRFKHIQRLYSSSTNIILVNTPKMRCGLVADSIAGIVEVPNEAIVKRDIVNPLDFSVDYSRLIAGEMKHGDHIVLLLNLDELLTVEVGEPSPHPKEMPVRAIPPDEVTRNELVFRARMHQLAMPIEEDQEFNKQAFSIVLIGGIRYAIEAIYILEFAHLKQCTPLPCSPAYILGAMNLRGEILSVIDLTSLLGIQSIADKKDVAILHFEAKKIALAVDRVESFKYFDRHLISILHDMEDHHAQCKALLKLEDDVAGIIDIQAVLIGNLLEVNEQV